MLRVGSLQYFIRPISSWTEFQTQVEALIATAQDYGIKVLVFPEYFTTQLLSLADPKLLINEHILELAKYEERIVEMLSTQAKKHRLVIVGGSLPGFTDDKSRLLNKSYVLSPNGDAHLQTKLHMTRFEKEAWLVTAGSGLKVFETDYAKFAVAICYDVEFPEIARAAARAGAHFLAVPSCTDDRQGYLRVRYCAQARAIENQMYVIHSPTVGSLPTVQDVSLNYGQAAIYTPSDFGFARDGLLAEGPLNQESMVVGDLDIKLIEKVREHGTVLTFKDSSTTVEKLKVVESVKITS